MLHDWRDLAGLWLSAALLPAWIQLAWLWTLLLCKAASGQLLSVCFLDPKPYLKPFPSLQCCFLSG